MMRARNPGLKPQHFATICPLARLKKKEFCGMVSRPPTHLRNCLPFTPRKAVSPLRSISISIPNHNSNSISAIFSVLDHHPKH